MQVYPKLFNLFYTKIVIDRIKQLFDLLLTLHRNKFNTLYVGLMKPIEGEVRDLRHSVLKSLDIVLFVT